MLFASRAGLTRLPSRLAVGYGDAPGVVRRSIAAAIIDAAEPWETITVKSWHHGRQAASLILSAFPVPRLKG
jgi:hypothetical protein